MKKSIEELRNENLRLDLLVEENVEKIADCISGKTEYTDELKEYTNMLRRRIYHYYDGGILSKEARDFYSGIYRTLLAHSQLE